MKKAYVSESSIKACVDYFSSLNITSGEQLGLFFFFKRLKFDEIGYRLFPKVSGISSEEKMRYLGYMYDLSALFERQGERGEKKCCLFPFSISESIGKKQHYNPGTAFSGLLSRMRDTIDNTLIDTILSRDDVNKDLFKFPMNYLDILKDKYLNGNRISLTYFAAWYFRFRGIDSPDEWFEGSTNDIYRGYTRVCIKILIEELNITEEELNKLFYKDENEYIVFSDKKITGSYLRSLLAFDNSYEPEIRLIRRGDNNYMNETEDVSIVRTEELAQPNGNNISKEKFKKILINSKQVILYGAPGTGKTFLTNEIKEDFKDVKLVQFHANTTYEQFIGGISIDEENSGNFTTKAGVFLDFCEKARNASDEKFLFIIDEINRGNVSKIFGETILALDRGYVANLAMPISMGDIKITEFSIPENVYIVATMNSADRSIAQIDYAIRRRFAFIKFYTNYEIIDSVSELSEIPGIKPSVLLKSINKKIFNILKDENMLLGHAYFIPQWAKKDDKVQWDYETLQILINYYIIPIIEEYTYGNTRYLVNILGPNLIKRIDNTQVFIDELKKQFQCE